MRLGQTMKDPLLRVFCAPSATLVILVLLSMVLPSWGQHMETVGHIDKEQVGHFRYSSFVLCFPARSVEEEREAFLAATAPPWTLTLS